MITILINKIHVGFEAAFSDGSGIRGYGETWVEAVGALFVMNHRAFGVDTLRFTRSPLTIEYRLKHGLDEEIK